MQSLISSKSARVTGGRGTAGAGPGRDLLYHSLNGSKMSHSHTCQTLRMLMTHQPNFCLIMILNLENFILNEVMKGDVHFLNITPKLGNIFAT